LIQQGAKLITSIEDILEELNPAVLSEVFREDRKGNSSKQDIALNSQDQELLNSFVDQPVTADQLIEKTKRSAAEVNVSLLTLEIKNFIKHVSGQGYVRNQK